MKIAMGFEVWPSVHDGHRRCQIAVLGRLRGKGTIGPLQQAGGGFREISQAGVFSEKFHKWDETIPPNFITAARFGSDVSCLIFALVHQIVLLYQIFSHRDTVYTDGSYTPPSAIHPSGPGRWIIPRPHQGSQERRLRFVPLLAGAPPHSGRPLPLHAFLSSPLLPPPRGLAAATFFTSSGSTPPAPLPSAPVASGDDSDQEGSLALRVQRAASVCAAIRGWIAAGRAVHRGHVFHAVNRLRCRLLHRTALQVMECVIRERPYKLSELDYSYLLEFTAKVHGISDAESLFLRIPQEYQNELLYNKLAMACLDMGLIKLSYGYMRKMIELSLPISPYVYNRLITLHSSPGRRKTVAKFLTQMRADCVTPHTSMYKYNVLLKVQANEHSVFNDMKRAKVEPNEITYGILAIAHAAARLYTVSQTYVEAIENLVTGTNWSTLENFLILYEYLGKEKELKKTWKLVQGLPHIHSKGFILAIEAFGKVGSFDQAEEIWGEIKSTRKLRLTEQFNSMLSVYCRHGLVDKASSMFKEMRENGCQPNTITYCRLALGCLKGGVIKEALKTMDMGKKVTKKVTSSTPWLETTHMLLKNFAEIGDMENARRVYEELSESKYCRNAFVYNTLLKAYAKAKIYEPDLVRAMILRGAMLDAETYSLLRLIEQFKI